MVENDSRAADADSFTDSIKRLGEDISVLVRQDLDSARAEMVEKAKRAGMGSGMLSGSAVAGLCTLLCLTGLVVVLLSLAMKLWVGLLIVTGLWAGTAAILALAGKRKIQKVGTPLPERAIKNIKADLQAAKREIHSNKQ